MRTVAKIISLVLSVFRGIVGVAVTHAGIQMVRGEGLLNLSQYGGLVTGFFVIGIGIVFIFSCLFPKIFWHG